FGDVAPVGVARPEDEPAIPRALIQQPDVHRDPRALAEADEDVAPKLHAASVLLPKRLDRRVDDAPRVARPGRPRAPARRVADRRRRTRDPPELPGHARPLAAVRSGVSASPVEIHDDGPLLAYRRRVV